MACWFFFFKKVKEGSEYLTFFISTLKYIKICQGHENMEMSVNGIKSSNKEGLGEENFA